MVAREVGHVKWFNEKKGFGFIRFMMNDQEVDIFVHYKDINLPGFKTLHENDVVSFILDKGPKGFKALDVILMADEDNNTRDKSTHGNSAKVEALLDP